MLNYGEIIAHQHGLLTKSISNLSGDSSPILCSINICSNQHSHWSFYFNILHLVRAIFQHQGYSQNVPFNLCQADTDCCISFMKSSGTEVDLHKIAGYLELWHKGSWKDLKWSFPHQ